MAKLIGFNILQGFSGKLGGQVVLKRRGDKTILSARPCRKKNKPTEKQADWQRKFKAAAEYAHKVLQDPQKREQYAKLAVKGKTLFNVAMADFLNNIKDHEKKRNFTIRGLFKRV